MSSHCAACEREYDLDPGGRDPEVCPHCGGLTRETRLGAYRLIGLIRRGGMAAVYRAEHVELGTLAAVKVLDLHPENRDMRERFAREARMAARVSHPGVVKVYDFDSRSEGLYLVMELVEGPTLRELIDGEPIAINRCLEFAADLADVLEAAHQAGVVHRDIKPENVVVDPRGAIRVLDFGIARAREEGESLTRTGEILGTPEYMAPEQILEAPEAIGPHTDVHAVGVVLYEMLTGRSPFAGANIFQVLKFVESLDPPPPSSLRAEIEPGVDSLVGSAMAKEIARRPQSAAAMSLALRELARENRTGGEAVPGRRHWPILLGLIGGLILVPLWLWHERPSSESRAVTVQSQVEVDAPQAAEVDRVSVAISRIKGGDLVRGLAELDQAVSAGRSDAIAARAIAWHLVYTLHAQLAPRMFWLGAPGDETVRTYFDLDAPGLQVGDSRLVSSAAALARGEYQSAARLLMPLESMESEDAWAPVLLVLALHGDGQKKAARTEWQRYFADDEHSVIGRLLDVLTSDARARASLMPKLVSELDRTWPDRYRLEAILALDTGDIPRLKAATELALVSGAGDPSLVFLASARVVLLEDSRAEMALIGDVWLRLIQRLDEIKWGTVPGLEATRLVLAMLQGDDEAVRAELREIPDLRHPDLQPFQAFREALNSNAPTVDLLRGLLCLQLGWDDMAGPKLEAALTRARQDEDFQMLVKAAFVASGPDSDRVRKWLSSRPEGTGIAAEAKSILPNIGKTLVPGD